MSHPVLMTNKVAVVTGAAMGIGLATCKRLASIGMRICMADIDGDELKLAEKEVAAVSPNGTSSVMSIQINVANIDELEALCERVYARFGEVSFLMNNAATRVVGGDVEDLEEWRRTVDVNFWGVANSVRVFLPKMEEQGTPCMIVNTGSKQGITNPPGNLIYNVTKSAVKTYTEGLQHELRNKNDGRISAHLLVPGWTTTGKRDHNEGAWLPEQVVDKMIASLENGDFYIICQDNDVTWEMDQKRIKWGASDITENRPPLSRWHPDWADTFNKSS